MTITINLDNLSLETVKAITKEVWKAQDFETISVLLNHLQKRMDLFDMRVFLDGLEPVGLKEKRSV